MMQEITCMGDVMSFIKTISNEVKTGNPFLEITRCRDDTYRGIYTAQEAETRDRLMNQCFAVCATESDDFIYLSLVVFEEALETIISSRLKSKSK